MVDSMIYYRTSNTTVSLVSNPINLPTAQKLSFVTPTNILEVVNETYVNNIIDIPVPISDGTRKINKQDNGLNSYSFSISGIFDKPVTDLVTLNLLRTTKQITTDHPYGCIGFYSPNAPQFNIDPIATRGLTIKNTAIGYTGQKKTRYGFSISLSFGGTI